MTVWVRSRAATVCGAIGRLDAPSDRLLGKSRARGQSNFVFSSPGRMPLSQYTHDRITATAV